MTQETSDQIKALGFFCTLLVVTIHCPSATFAWTKGSVDVPRGVAMLQFAGSDTISRLAVPWFLLVSGFFLVHRLPCKATLSEMMQWWQQTILKRVMTLGIPYLLWNLIYYVFKLAIGKYPFAFDHCFAEITGWNLQGGLACGQFWYIRCVIVYVLVAPIFVLVMRHHEIGGTVLALLCVAWIGRLPQLSITYVQPMDYSYLLFFASGVFVSLHASEYMCSRRVENLTRILTSAAFLICSVGVVFCGGVRNVALGQVFGKWMILFGLPMLWLNRGLVCRLLRPLNGFVNQAFFLYAFHVIVVSVMGTVLRSMPDLGYHTVGYVLKVVVAICVSLFVGKMLERFLHPLFRMLCGGRA